MRTLTPSSARGRRHPALRGHMSDLMSAVRVLDINIPNCISFGLRGVQLWSRPRAPFPAFNVFASDFPEPVEGTVILENERADYVVGDGFPESAEDCS